MVIIDKERSRMLTRDRGQDYGISCKDFWGNWCALFYPRSIFLGRVWKPFDLARLGSVGRKVIINNWRSSSRTR
jgi:hypothetical protein